MSLLLDHLSTPVSPLGLSVCFIHSHTEPEPSSSTSQNSSACSLKFRRINCMVFVFPKHPPVAPLLGWARGAQLRRGIAWEAFLLYSLTPHPPSHLAVKLLENVREAEVECLLYEDWWKGCLRKCKYSSSRGEIDRNPGGQPRA